MSSPSRTCMLNAVQGVVVMVATLGLSSQAFAQICRPISERTRELGCWIIVDDGVGQLPQAPMFWHLDSYPTRAARLRVSEASGGISSSSVSDGCGRTRWISVSQAASTPCASPYAMLDAR